MEQERRWIHPAARTPRWHTRVSWSTPVERFGLRIPKPRSFWGGFRAILPTRNSNCTGKPILKTLQEKRWGGAFDFFDYHNFNTFQNYEAGTCRKNLDFFKKMLATTGFADKPVLIKAGGTHSGWDFEAKNQRLHQKQTEAEQAAYLVKRFVRLAAQGSPLILWGTVRETEFSQRRHDTYSHNGLVYNGIPEKGRCDPAKEDPCPDPGDGVKKLSYYAFKFFMQNFKDADWSEFVGKKE